MGFGGSSTPQTTTQKTSPWSGQQPYLLDIFKQAKQNYNSTNPSYYPGQTVANISPATTQAQSMMTNWALNPNKTAATDAASGVAAGNLNRAMGTESFLTNPALLNPNSNPYLRASVQASMNPVIQNFQESVMPSIAGGAAGANAAGSTREGIAQGMASQALAKTLGDIGAQQYSQAYNTGLSTMGQALALAPSLSSTAVSDAAKQDALKNQLALQSAQQLSTVGAQQQAEQQAQINADMNKWNFNQNLPAQKLGQYLQMVQGNYGGTNITTAPGVQTNPIMSGLGGALMGASMASTIGLTGGVGAGLGGGLGLLSAFM